MRARLRSEAFTSCASPHHKGTCWTLSSVQNAPRVLAKVTDLKLKMGGEPAAIAFVEPEAD